MVRFAIVDTTLTTAPTGGCQTFLEHLAPALKTRGHEVLVVTEPGCESAVADRLLGAGVTVLDQLWPRRFLPEERSLRLAEWCHRERIDAYVISVSRDVGWLALPYLPPATQTAAVVQLDSPAFYQPLAHYGPFVDHAIGVSRETTRKTSLLCDIPEGRTCHIPYGVKRLSEAQLAERLRPLPASRPLEVAYVGRLVHSQKRVLDLVPIVEELAGRGLPFVLHLIGAGEDALRLRKEFARRRVGQYVRWWGWLSPAQVGVQMRTLDALVLPSDVEGLPLVLLEAMGHGVVPIVTRIPSGHIEVVRDGGNGFLVAVGDSKGFADRLEQLQQDPGLLLRLRRAAWSTSEDYSVEHMASQYEACFARAGGRAPRPPGSFPVMPSCRSRHPRALRKLKWWIASLLPVARRAQRRARYH